MADVDQIDQIKPLIPESNFAESTNVVTILDQLDDNTLKIPDYQRDSDQWDDITKSLFVESVINNLSIPAFFFETKVESGIQKDDVVDGQQRLTTLSAFYKNDFEMVGSEDAPYLSPHSVHYARKRFNELPEAYKSAFKRYRLTIIKLRDLGDMRLEVFRRINQGGTPLSGQDIRLAYYGKDSRSLSLIRLAGVYDRNRSAAQRFEESAKKLGVEYPWKNEDARKNWKEWWSEKEIARGQTASETFLWAIISAQYEKVDAIIKNSSALTILKCRFNGALDAVLDACCAQLSYQDKNENMPPALMPYTEMKDEFFPMFEEWYNYLLGRMGTSLPIAKHRSISAVIGAAYACSLSPSDLNEQQWTDIVEFIRHPQDFAKKFEIHYPKSMGRWGGAKGYKAQLDAAAMIVRRIVT